MGITIPQAAARQRLEEAFEWASSGRPVPEAWTQFAQQTFQMAAKTYTPALGTVLLARATDARVDPLSIKTEYGSTTYSLRTLGHEVLVPAARQLGFSIRNTGQEPLNNQPFFRYDHMSAVERVRNRPEYDRFVAGVSKIGSADRDEALAALAAFLRVAINAARQLADYTVAEGALTVPRVVAAVESFLGEGVDRPRRTQALIAAAFDVTHDDVRSRKINDPSRDYPGDVQAFEGDEPILAVEARAKSVRATEVESFVSACREAGVERAFMIVLWPAHQALPAKALRRKALDDADILLTIIEDVEDLLLDVFGWSDLSLAAALRTFTVSVLTRLKEIEATDHSLAQWVSLLGQLRSQADGDD
ncbi:MAG TPA: restriction endonuclease, SacI family [Streptosporangiaceae bacterium]|nr:restriction endonuclease, SacI family [Streptosporangiaceae bacterium]